MTLPSDRLPPDVLKLGFVSLPTDLSSEMIFPVFAVFFTSVAGASNALLGATSSALVFSLAAGLSAVAIALFVGLKPAGTRA